MHKKKWGDSKEMKISVIIPVKGINEYVMESHEHLKRQDYASFEVIVFPDRDTGVKLDGARIIATGPVGPAEKRDLAIKYAEGDILAFLDDDAYPARGWLKGAAARFEDDAVGAVGGPAVTPESDTRLQRASGAVFSSVLTSSKYVYRYLPRKEREVDDFPTVNLFVRKSVFEKLGGFDTAYWPGEDTKLCLDITRKLGLKIIYDPGVVVYHHRRPLFIPHLKQVSRYAFQRGRFVRALPDTSLRPGYFIPSIFLIFICAGVLLPVFPRAAFVFWAAVLSIYAVFLAAASIASMYANRDAVVGVLTFPGIFLTHLIYGYGFLRGLLSAKKGIEAIRLNKAAKGA
ncbi:MAG: glycosyltransferase [Deltaproteobacteria bacterium]